ncbi:MAG: glycerol-3-phosphate acyltransferase [Actinobacteria bacterium]|nr:glycerol-3-phosphate acyltransferase [Actinomycetota bacterium]
MSRTSIARYRPARQFAASAALAKAVSIAGGYLLGSLPSADVVSAIAGVGIRTSGTGNPGTLNAAVVAGKRWGSVVAGLDIGKGWLAAAIGARISPATANAAGVAAVVGHIFPIWSGGRGGKGVATSFGVVLGTFPAYAIPDLAIAAAAAKATASPVRANQIASTAWTGAAVLWWWRAWPNLWGPKPTLALPLGALSTSVLLAWRMNQPDSITDGDRWGASQ